MTEPVTLTAVFGSRVINDGPSLASVVEERVQREFAKALDEAVWAMMLHHHPHRQRRPTALRLAPGGRSFETVELDSAGNVIEPPPRCHCTVIHRADCPNRYVT